MRTGHLDAESWLWHPERAKISGRGVLKGLRTCATLEQLLLWSYCWLHSNFRDRSTEGESKPPTQVTHIHRRWQSQDSSNQMRACTLSHPEIPRAFHLPASSPTLSPLLQPLGPQAPLSLDPHLPHTIAGQGFSFTGIRIPRPRSIIAQVSVAPKV